MRLKLQSTLARSSQYRPDIDGLRAVAVLSVLFFHARVPGVPGGFVGVDVFFVISGYLITSIIANDISLNKFSLVSFYERRMRRIFPALFFLIFGSGLIAAALLAPEDFPAFAKGMFAATCFASNFFFLRHAAPGGYFANIFALQPLLHTWSLAVEEQFYLLFPGLLLLLTKFAKQRTQKFLIVLALVSLIANLWLLPRNPSSAFYMLFPRAWELLMGSLLALKAVPSVKLRFLRESLGAAGIALIAFADLAYTSNTTFPGWHALIPCLGACLVIYAGEQGTSFANSVLAFPPLVFIGLISYSLYLWHWPLIVFSRYFFAADLSHGETAGVIIASLLMAFLSFEFVETPFRGHDSRFSRKQVFSLAIAASFASLALAFLILRTGGLPQRYNASTRQLVVENAARRHDFMEVCSNFQTNPHSWADINYCTLGPDSKKKILFGGDSHVQQLYPIVKHLYDTGELQGRGAIVAVGNSCLPDEHMNGIGVNLHCDSFSSVMMTRAGMDDIDTVFIAFNTWWTYHDNAVGPTVNGKRTRTLSAVDSQRLFLSDFADELRQLRKSGKRIIICLPFPAYDKSIPNLEIKNAVFSRFGLAGVARDMTVPEFRKQLIELSRAVGADVFDPRKSLCSQGGCLTQKQGVSIYIDNNHIAASQVVILEDNLRQVLQNQGNSSSAQQALGF